MVVQHKVKPPSRVHALPERYVDDLVDPLGPLVLVKSRLEQANGGSDRFRLADGAEVRPCCADLPGIKKRCADPSERRDVTLLVGGPRRLGEVSQRSRLDQGQIQVESRSE